MHSKMSEVIELDVTPREPRVLMIGQSDVLFSFPGSSRPQTRDKTKKNISSCFKPKEKRFNWEALLKVKQILNIKKGKKELLILNIT